VLYAILCYNSEEVVGSWSKEEDDAVMKRLVAVQDKLAAEGRLGPVARLKGTAAATTLRKAQDRIAARVIDGPFAETKEQFLGFYVVDCKNIEDAVSVARELADANRGPGGYEIRPIASYFPGGKLS
jgi:hypothetical protein